MGSDATTARERIYHTQVFALPVQPVLHSPDCILWPLKGFSGSPLLFCHGHRIVRVVTHS